MPVEQHLGTGAMRHISKNADDPTRSQNTLQFGLSYSCFWLRTGFCSEVLVIAARAFVIESSKDLILL